jgi:hypothetical protein
MQFKDKINQEVLNRTGFDVPELGGKVKLSRPEILEALKHAKRWHENYAQDCIQAIDNIIRNEFTDDERTAGA